MEVGGWVWPGALQEAASSEGGSLEVAGGGGGGGAVLRAVTEGTRVVAVGLAETEVGSVALVAMEAAEVGEAKEVG